MSIWSAEIKEIERLYQTIKGRFPEIENELERLIKTYDENIVLVYSRRCLEVIITELCETELDRPRKTEPLKGIIDKLAHEGKVPSHIIASMDGLNTLSTFGAHPKDFDPEQVKPVLVNLAVIIKWYLKYKESWLVNIDKKEEGASDIIQAGKKSEIKGTETSRPLLRRLKMKFLIPALVLLSLITFYIFASGSALPFSKRDWIVITDFENLTGNPVFDNSLYTAFSICTGQSRYINILPRSRMLETLNRMEIKDKISIDDKTGREIAIREGIEIYIVPSISEVGNRYAIAAKILEAKSGEILKSEILYADNQDDILPELDKLSRRLRRILGESRYNIATLDKPLKTVTTSSLEALKLYSLGIDHHILLDFNGARDYYEKALQIDTGFTAAKASLGSILIERFDPVQGRVLLNQAVKSVDNLTEKEKLGILAFHAVNVENDFTKGIKYAKMRVELYPDDAASHNNLGWYYQNTGLYEEAVKQYKETVRIDHNWALTYGGIVWIYIEFIGQADSALLWAKNMVSVHPQNAWGYFYLGSAWLCIDSIVKAEAAFEKVRELSPDFIPNLFRLANAYRLQGKHDKALSVLHNILEIKQTQPSGFHDVNVSYEEENIQNETSVYYDLGVNLQEMGNAAEARNYFLKFQKIATEELLAKMPNNAGTYIVLGAVYARLNDLETSALMLQKAMEIDSTMHNRFAELLCLQGKVPEAIDQLDNAFKNGYRNLIALKENPDLQVLFYDVRFHQLMNKYFH
jgi:tetratricopeptide (TPR) repeat protein